MKGGIRWVVLNCRQLLPGADDEPEEYVRTSRVLTPVLCVVHLRRCGFVFQCAHILCVGSCLVLWSGYARAGVLCPCIMDVRTYLRAYADGA